ncbi:MAG: hypothetical protein JOY90_38310 [Bradyrhizobium sp.]|uniref:hypothetical protein n=1 Tax=Bradyrhizobium sp. TaxID=376 RepID=UPI001DE52AF0|nr:hypothetical protein [Bradyrhizobium sp.]MBV9566258.1 hypothetical protein [Bradyrhizobium sp.]
MAVVVDDKRIQHRTGSGWLFAYLILAAIALAASIYFLPAEPGTTEADFAVIAFAP